MNEDLFVNIDQQKETKESSNYYEKVIEQRTRPGIQPEPKPAGASVEKETPVAAPVRPELTSYPYEEVIEKATEYFQGDSLAANVWANKYALKDSAGKLYELTPDDMHRRLAREVARIERKYPNPLTEDELFELFRHFRYIIPQGSPMAGIGNDFQVPFMERYSNSTREVAQDGRRGALMLSISIKHPDSEKFIDAKLEQGKVTGANVSVKLDDEFMQAVQNKETYTQQFPIDSENPVFIREINARELWNKIIHNAWKSAEPGVLFWDTVLRESVPDCYADLGYKTVSTNPCGEIPLCPYDSCRLLAVNLYSYVDKPFTSEASFNSELFTKHAHLALRIMDDIIDLEIEKIDAILKKIDSDPEDEEIKRVERNMWENIRRMTINGRRTGIGITAEGDMLAALSSRYGSEEAISFATEVHKLLAIEVYSSSVKLARERGAFPVFDSEREKDNPFISRIREAAPRVYENMLKYGRRNIAMLTIAPTGSVSICTQTTSGIEPAFMIAYKRRRKVNPNDKNVTVSFVDEVGDAWEEYNVFHPKFEVWLSVNGYNVEKVKQMNDKELQKIIRKSPYFQATSNDIDWVSKVKMQGSIQKWVDHSISVTVNIPEETPEELVSQIYMTAWESGCKGMTIYRDGSRSGVLVSSDKKKEDDPDEFRETNAPKRPHSLEAEIVRFHNDNDKWVAVVGLLNNKPYEIFTGKEEGFFLPKWVDKGWVLKNKTENGKNRYDFQFLDKDGYKITMEGLSRQFDKEYWNYAKLISGILRHGMPLPFAVDLVGNLQLEKDSINTWKNGVVRALKKFIPNGTKIKKQICEACGEADTLQYQEGCMVCTHCGNSKCS